MFITNIGILNAKRAFKFSLVQIVHVRQTTLFFPTDGLPHPFNLQYRRQWDSVCLYAYGVLRECVMARMVYTILQGDPNLPNTGCFR